MAANTTATGTTNKFAQTLGLLIGAALLLWVSAWQIRWFVGGLYLQATQRAEQVGIDSINLASAWTLTAQLMPWNAQVWEHLATYQNIGEGENVASTSMNTALELAPLDANIWVSAAQQHFGHHPTDDEVVRRLAQGLRLWPQNENLRYRVAWWGISSWVYGSPKLQALWRQQVGGLSLESLHRIRFDVFAAEREVLFCQVFSPHPEKDDWCRGVAWLRNNCMMPGLPDAARSWCQLYGL